MNTANFDPDDFLAQFRKAPNPKFAKRLYDKLSKQGEDMTSTIIEMPQTIAHAPNGKTPHTVTARPTEWDRRITLFAALLTIAIFGSLIVYVNQPRDSLHPAYSPAAQANPPITTENAPNLTRLARLGEGYINGVIWSPDGRTLALPGSLGVWIYDRGDLSAPQYLLEEPLGFLNSVFFSSDGRMMAFSTLNGIKLWDMETREFIEPPNPLSGTHGQNFGVIAFSPDGSLVAAGDFEGTIRIWELATGELKSEINVFFNYTYIQSLAFNPDGTRLAFAGTDTPVLMLVDQSGTWENWDDEPLVYQPETRSEAGTGTLRFTADGARIAARVGAMIIVWDVESAEIIQTLDLTQPVNEANRQGGGGGSMKGGGGDLSFSPDGRQVATVDSDVRIWNVETGESRLLIDGPNDGSGYLGGVAFSPDWAQAAALGQNGLLNLYDLATGEVIETSQLPNMRGVTEVIFGGDDLMAAASDDGLIRIWDTSDLANLPAPALISTQQTGVVYYGDSAVTFSPDGGRVIVSRGENAIFIWDVREGGLVAQWEGLTERHSQAYLFPQRLALINPAGNTIVTSSDGGALLLVNAQTGEVELELGFAEGAPTAAAFSADGRLLAVGLAPNSYFTGPMPGENQPPTFSIQIIDRETGQTITTLTGHIDLIRALAFNPADANQIASTANDGSVLIWDVAAGEMQQVGDLSNYSGSLAYSPDGSLLVTTDYEDQTSQFLLALWDAATGESLAQVPLDGTVTAVSFRPDGALIAVSYAAGVVELWGIE